MLYALVVLSGILGSGKAPDVTLPDNRFVTIEYCQYIADQLTRIPGERGQVWIIAKCQKEVGA